MKICITGGQGFCASNVANYLKDKHNILAVDNLKFSDKKNLDEDVQFLEKDFNDLSESFLDQFDLLIHMACANIIYAQTELVDTFKVNALDTINLFKKFKGRIIYTSTASIYGQSNLLPTPENVKESVSNAYDQSKLIAEKFLQLRGNYTTLRLSNVYGPNQRPENIYSGVVAKFIEAGVKGKPMQSYGRGKDTRDYTYISDVVDAVYQAIKSNPTNCELNISGNCEASIIELASVISTCLWIPINMKVASKRDIDNISRRWLDCSKAYKLIGWKPKVSLIEGIKKTIAWYKGEY